MLRHNTPLEFHRCGELDVLVKRDDLCCDPPGPALAKIRGVVPHLMKRSEDVIGVLDTRCSRGGWAVAYVAKQLGKRCFNFFPQYKHEPPMYAPTELRVSQRHANELGAQCISVPAGRSNVMFYQARAMLRDLAPGAMTYMMPNALKMEETISGNAEEARQTVLTNELTTLVLPVGTGTIAAGVLLGLQQADILEYLDVVLYEGYSRPEERVLGYIEKATGLTLDRSRTTVVDEGWKYGTEQHHPVPFPASTRYEAKAWNWLASGRAQAVIDEASRVLFWNSGD